jgi:hypothetical protein
MEEEIHNPYISRGAIIDHDQGYRSEQWNHDCERFQV